MRRRAVPVLAFTLAALGLLAGSAPATAAVATRTVEHSIPATGKIVIANLAGTIDLVSAASGPLKVVATVHAEGASASETRELLEAMRWVQERDGTWNLAWPVDRYDEFSYLDDVRSWGSSSSGRFRGERVRVYGRPRRGAPMLYADLSISVPRGSELVVRNVVGNVRGRHLAARLTVDTGSGNVKLTGVDGSLSVDTGSGDIDLADVSGTLRLDTGSGDVRIEGAEGPSLHVDTGSGDVLVTRGRLPEVKVDTGSGDIEIVEVQLTALDVDTGSGDVIVRGGLAGARQVRIDTGSGGVHLLGGRDFEFDLVTDVGSGNVRVGYEDAEVRRSRRDITGARRGSGRTTVVVGTGSGDVVVAPLSRR
jgi:hypothetical protein